MKLDSGFEWRLTHPAPEAVWLGTLIVNMFGGPDALPWTPETLLGLKPKGIKGHG